MAEGKMMLEGFFALFSNLMLFTAKLDGGNSFPHPLSPEKEKEYLDKFRATGDMNARNILVKHNLRLVVFIAKKYVNYPDNDELISVGTLGLIKAIDTFNPSKGSQLATYASRCIENEILMTMRSYKKRAQDVSIYDSIGCDKEGNELPIVDLLQTEDETVYAKLDCEFMKKTVRELIEKHLGEREKAILTMRFGLEDDTPRTQQWVADKLNISRSYISRIEKKALSKLRKAIADENIQI
jgi:RNA polymerase sporulation-specific sigma factor